MDEMEHENDVTITLLLEYLDLKESDLKADTPSSVDQSPAAGKGRGKGQRRTRKIKNPPGQVAVSQIGMGQSPLSQGQPGIPMQGVQGPNAQMQHMAYGQGPGGIPQQQNQQFGGNPNQQQWYNQQQQQQQQGYYPQQMPNVNRFERPQQINNQSKQALSNMLRQRHPLNQFMPGPAGQAPGGPGPQASAYGPMQRQFPRQGIRQQHPAAMQQNQGMFQQQYSNMQAGMSQQYGNYGGNPSNMMQTNMQSNQQMIQGAQGGMFPGQQQSFGQPRPPQPDYRGMAQNPRPQYMQQAPNVTMNTNMNTMAGMGGAQGGPAPPYSRPASQGMQPNVQAQQNQFQQQQRMRHQMLAMQQQQPGGQGALVAHLQRQMNPNPYQHQPPAYNMG